MCDANLIKHLIIVAVLKKKILHILKYVAFIRDKSIEIQISEGLLRHWFVFSEVKQNWLGFSKVGNNGSGSLRAGPRKKVPLANEPVVREVHDRRLSLLWGEAES